MISPSPSISPLSTANRKAYRYWRDRCAGRAMPSRADIDPVAMKPFLPHLILLDVSHDPLDFCYRLIGTLVAEHLHENHTGQRMSEIPHQKNPSAIWTICARVVAERDPRLGQVPYVGPKKDFVTAEDVIMPLSSDGSTVNMLLVSVDFFPAKPAGYPPPFPS